MRGVLILIALTGCVWPVVVAAQTAAQLELRPEVVVHAEHLRIMDLSAVPMDSELGRTVLCAAPAPGHERSFDRAGLLREIVRAGVRPVPTLSGAERVRVQRPGQSVDPQTFAQRLRRRLEALPSPEGALDQRWVLHALPGLRIGAGEWQIRLDGEPPRVGRGSIAVELITEHGDRRRAFVSLSREVFVPVLRASGAVDAGSRIAPANAHADTLWTTDRWVLDDRVVLDESDGRWTLRRRAGGGHVLLQRDVRPTPVIRRGELVDWVVERGELRVSVSARSRGDGAPGDWILVESPFDRRLRRVYVVGPHRVADHPPDTGQSFETSQEHRGERP